MKWTIGRKLAAGFAAVLLILVSLAALANWDMTQLSDTATAVAHSREVLLRLEDVISTEKDCETGQRGFLLTGFDRYLEPYTAGVERIHTDVSELEKLVEGSQAQAHSLEKLEPFIDEKQAELKSTIDAYRQKGKDAALAIVVTDKGKDIMDSIRGLVTEMETAEQSTLKKKQDEADASVSTTRSVLGLGVFLSVLLVIALAYFLTRSTTQPVTELLHAVQRMENGDLRLEKLGIVSNDEIGMLVMAFNSMLGSLRDLTRQSQGAAENLNAATSQISASTRQQAASLTEQFEAVQETTTTMTEVAQSGAQIADKAREVGASAQASSTSTISGLAAVQSTSRTMETIREQVEVVAENIVALSEKTQAIGEIIATVNDLAERSNLLAFNAAIEAASVGDEGSRFSVVANELKNLADQSKESTVQVRSILGDIQKGIHSSVMLTEEAVKRVESGRSQAEAAEQVIRQSAEASQSSVRAFQQIVAATNQQQIGFDQVAIALQNIRRASEQNSQGISQLDTAAANMSALSQQLRKAVERFQV